MSFFTALVTSKIAAGALAGTLAVGGTAAAAYTETLPAALQQSAHSVLGAPAASAALATHETADAAGEATPTAEATASASADASEKATPTDSPSSTPVGPDATGPAAYGLCQSFTHGGLDTSSTAYKSLAVAAEGETNITTYCATVASPGESADHRPAEPGAAAATAHLPADAAARIPAAPRQGAHAVTPAAPQQAATGTAHKPATAGRP